MNSVNLMGRITADPELKATASGISVCTFTIAVKRPHAKETTDFIRCVAWRGTAEFIDKYFSKGKMIALSGVLTVRKWKDDHGKNHSVSEVVVDSVFFCGGKSDDQKKPETVTDQQGLDNIEQTFGTRPEQILEYTQEEISSVYDQDIPF